MKPILGLVASLLINLPMSRAGNSTIPAAITTLPSCALTCLISGLANSSCSATDITCQCADVHLYTQVERCVLSTCEIKEALTAKNTTSTICGIQPRDHSRVIGILGITGGTLAITAVLLRCILKLQSLGGGFWWDDWTIMFTTIFVIPFAALSYIASIGRLGKDIWAIPLNDIVVFFHQFYFAEILYAAILSLTKMSILFFYLRIFPGVRLRRATWCLIIVSALNAITFVLVDAFQCTPAKYYWRQWDGESGRCMNPSGPAWSVSAIGIVIDFLMLALPLYQIRQLNLPWQKKLTVSLMFGVGFFVTIVSILRLQSLVHFRNTTNPTYDYYSIGYWSIVEVNIGVICACMPSIRVLVKHFFPGIMGSSCEHTSGSFMEQPPASSLHLREQTTGRIHYTTSYSIKHDPQLDRNGSKFVQLVDIEGAASSRSEVSVLERV